MISRNITDNFPARNSSTLPSDYQTTEYVNDKKSNDYFNVSVMRLIRDFSLISYRSGFSIFSLWAEGFGDFEGFAVAAIDCRGPNKGTHGLKGFKT